MQKDLKGKKGNSLENAIVLDAQDSITGVAMEHGYIDQLIDSLDADVISVKQNLIIENGRQYDKFVIKMNDGNERVLYFDISSFFGKISVGGQR